MYQIVKINPEKEIFEPVVLVNSVDEGNIQLAVLLEEMKLKPKTYSYAKIEKTSRGFVLFARAKDEKIIIEVIPEKIKSFGDYSLHLIQKQESNDFDSIIF